MHIEEDLQNNSHTSQDEAGCGDQSFHTDQKPQDSEIFESETDSSKISYQLAFNLLKIYKSAFLESSKTGGETIPISENFDI